MDLRHQRKDPTRKQNSRNIDSLDNSVEVVSFIFLLLDLYVSNILLYCSSLAMETRNAIFRDAMMSLEAMYPDVEKSELASSILKNLPSHFDAFGAKKTYQLENPAMVVNVTNRDLEKACHGFPLHLPGHVVPCRDDSDIQCNDMDQTIRR